MCVCVGCGLWCVWLCGRSWKKCASVWGGVTGCVGPGGAMCWAVLPEVCVAQAEPVVAVGRVGQKVCGGCVDLGDVLHLAVLLRRSVAQAELMVVVDRVVQRACGGRVGLGNVLHQAVLLRVCVVRAGLVVAVDRVVQKVCGDRVDLGDVLHQAVLLKGSERVGLGGVLRLVALPKGRVAQAELVVAVDRVGQRAHGDRLELGASVELVGLESLAVRVVAGLDGLVGKFVRRVCVRCGLRRVWVCDGSRVMCGNV